MKILRNNYGSFHEMPHIYVWRGNWNHIRILWYSKCFMWSKCAHIRLIYTHTPMNTLPQNKLQHSPNNTQCVCNTKEILRNGLVGPPARLPPECIPNELRITSVAVRLMMTLMPSYKFFLFWFNLDALTICKCGGTADIRSVGLSVVWFGCLLVC